MSCSKNSSWPAGDSSTWAWKKRLAGLEIKGRIETIQSAALLRSTKILRGVLETWGDLFALRHKSEMLSVDTDIKKKL